MNIVVRTATQQDLNHAGPDLPPADTYAAVTIDGLLVALTDDYGSACWIDASRLDAPLLTELAELVVQAWNDHGDASLLPHPRLSDPRG